MPLTCHECDRLWDELADANRAYAERIREQRFDGFEPGLSDLMRLSDAIREAADARQTVRRAILDHASTHDSPARVAAAAGSAQGGGD